MTDSGIGHEPTCMRFRLWVILASGLFIIGLAAGLVIMATNPVGIVDFFSKELSAFENFGSIFGPFRVSTAVFIFLKNASVLVFSFIFSPILCLLPILALALNGALLSFVSALVAQKESFGLVLAGILPHGIIEIPALIIGEAASLSFGVMVIMAVLSPTWRSRLSANFKQTLKYLLLAFILLVPAAIIETFVTPLFLSE